MTDLNALRSPMSFLRSELKNIPHRDVLEAEQDWWKSEGIPVSEAIDRGGTPWLRMFDRGGKRVDEILYPREYQTILKRGYRFRTPSCAWPSASGLSNSPCFAINLKIG
jgi:acyl-CoA dehydrogenase